MPYGQPTHSSGLNPRPLGAIHVHKHPPPPQHTRWHQSSGLAEAQIAPSRKERTRGDPSAQTPFLKLDLFLSNLWFYWSPPSRERVAHADQIENSHPRPNSGSCPSPGLCRPPPLRISILDPPQDHSQSRAVKSTAPRNTGLSLISQDYGSEEFQDLYKRRSSGSVEKLQ